MTRVWRCGSHRLPLGGRPLVMGVLNITPDSFSDGSRWLDPDRAVERALQMVDEGADIIDVGGESTRPGAPPVDPETERRRILPVITRLAPILPIPLSVDTTKVAVAAAALDAGASIINDISGLTFEPDMTSCAARTGCGVVLMHTRGTPQTMQMDTRYDDLLGEVISRLGDSVSHAIEGGVSPDSIVVDPGIGFGKDWRGNLELLRRLPEIARRLPYPLLVGTSRKSFIGVVTGRGVGDRLFGTAATVALAVQGGASVVRVHDVREMRDVADMAAAISGRWSPEGEIGGFGAEEQRSPSDEKGTAP